MMHELYHDMVIDDTILESQCDVLISYGNMFEKAIIMESEEYNVSNVSKLKQFINWVSRTINTILAKLNKKMLEKKIEKITEMNIDVTKIQIDSAYIDMMDRLISDDSAVNKQKYSVGFGDGFKKERARNYEKYANYIQSHKIEKVEKSTNKRNVTIETLKKWFSFIKKQGINMATRLTQINEHITLLKNNMSNEEINTAAFQQYVRMLTLMLTNDLRIVESLNNILSEILKLKKSDEGTTLDTEDYDIDDSNKNDKTNSIDDYPPSVNETYEPPAIINTILNKFVFNKHKNADAIYVTLDNDGDTVKVIYNVSTNNKVKPKMHKFSLQKYKNKIPWKALVTPGNIERVKRGIKISKG